MLGISLVNLFLIMNLNKIIYLLYIRNLEIGDSGTEGIMRGLKECPKLNNLIYNLS